MKIEDHAALRLAERANTASAGEGPAPAWLAALEHALLDGWPRPPAKPAAHSKDDRSCPVTGAATGGDEPAPEGQQPYPEVDAAQPPDGAQARAAVESAASRGDGRASLGTSGTLREAVSNGRGAQSLPPDSRVTPAGQAAASGAGAEVASASIDPAPARVAAEAPQQAANVVAALTSTDPRQPPAPAPHPEGTSRKAEGQRAPQFARRLLQVGVNEADLRINVRDATLSPRQQALVAQALFTQVRLPGGVVARIYVNGTLFGAAEPNEAEPAPRGRPISTKEE